MTVQHSSESNEHYTPVAFIEAARTLMGSIDLDPATTAKVNSRTVQARHFYTQREDGLSLGWHGNVWLNPPGGVTKGRSNAAIWFQKLAVEWAAGRTAQAVFVGFTLEILRSTQSGPCWIGDLPMCFPDKRIQFLDTAFQSQKSPGHANVIAYFPPILDIVKVHEFSSIFSQFGRVRL